jgi:hypothetical protein
MTISLRDIARCFGGEIPSLIATCSADGEPNLAHLSQVFLVDDEHVATSNQFFGKTAANLRENPLATVLCIDPDEIVSYKLLLRHEGSEDKGQRFEDARRSIDIIASLTGMEQVFALRCIDVYRVLDIALVPSRGTRSFA